MTRSKYPSKPYLLIPISVFSILTMAAFGIYPNKREISHLGSEIETLNQKIKEQQALSPLFKKILREIQKRPTALLSKKNETPAAIHPDKISGSLNTLAKMHRLDFTKLSSNASLETWKNSVLPVRVSISGALSDIREMLITLSGLNYLDGIKSFQLSTKGDRRTLVLSLLLKFDPSTFKPSAGSLKLGVTQ